MKPYQLLSVPLFSFLTPFALGSAAGQWLNPDITVISSDECSLVFEYRPAFTAEQTVRQGTTDLRLIDFLSSAMPSNARVGEPDVRCRRIPLGFPSELGNEARVVAMDYKEISGITLAPVPRMQKKDSIGGKADYVMDGQMYSMATLIPSDPLDLPTPHRSRSMWIGGVNIFPIQYNPSTHTVRKYSRFVVEVIYGALNRRRIQNQDDAPFKEFLLNYSIARHWKFASETTMKMVMLPSSVLATGDWYRLTVVDEGVYALSASYLRAIGLDPGSMDPRTIKIYGNGGRELPENNTSQRPSDLLENAIYVEGESDGRFDEGDFVLFFGMSARGWDYDLWTHLLSHYINHYSDQNFYWLTFGGGPGRRMAVQQSLTDNAVASPSTFLDMALVEEERANLLGSGREWFGRSYNPGQIGSYSVQLPGLASGGTITYRFRLVARSDVSSYFTLSLNGLPLGGSYPLSQIRAYDADGPFATSTVFSATGSSSLNTTTVDIDFTYHSGSISATGWNDWIEIQYPRTLQAANGNFLRFRSPDNVDGVAEYTLGQFTGSPYILDVTQPDSVRRIVGATGTYTFRVREVSGRVSEYCAATPGAFRQPVGATRIDNQNLHGNDESADFVIVTSAEYRTAADRLKACREQSQHGGLATVVIDVNQVYNEFGGGLPDVSAIRDYLKYAYTNWRRPPRFVLFLGQGSYDYKGISGNRSSFVPTWESMESLDDVASYSTDDFFVEFGNSSAPFLVTGRVNARPNRYVDEADAFVTKLIRYENESSRDAWKMRMLFVGDDGFMSGGLDPLLTAHSQQEEILARYFTPDEFDKRKIYEAEYPAIQTVQGLRRPGAYQAIIDRINEGALVVNFTGHGNPTVWTHESIFTVETSIPELMNANKLPVVFVATCNFSYFDDLKRYSGSELLINKSDGGAIGVVGATRKSYSDLNARLHQGVFANMFGRDQQSGRLTIQRPATAIWLYKQVSNDGNDQKYFYLGDPTMKLQYPDELVSIDSINHQALTGTPVQVRALERISVSGTVRDVLNQPDSVSAGRVLLTVNDASRDITIVNFVPNSDWSYRGAGGTIYRGENSLRNGRFSATFVVPKDILYADSSSRGRIAVYLIDSTRSSEGGGYTNSLRVGGTADVLPDTTGPSMMLYLDSRSFRPGDVVGENPTLIVDLVDSNGINTSVSGVGHRIETWINGTMQSKDITEYYTGHLDDYQRGTVQYSLKGLPVGRNALRVRAWDTFNNATSMQTYFEVASTDQLRIFDVFNYPNPFASGTTFTFKQNLQTSLDVKIRIYTVAGRLIQTLEAYTPGEPFVKVVWDGRDRDGDMLANGVYLYKVVVRSTDGSFGSEVLGKLSVLR